MPTKTIQYSVPLKYGYLEIGDIIELSDVDLGFSGLKVQLLSKQYNENRWVMEFNWIQTQSGEIKLMYRPKYWIVLNLMGSKYFQMEITI